MNVGEKILAGILYVLFFLFSIWLLFLTAILILISLVYEGLLFVLDKSEDLLKNTCDRYENICDKLLGIVYGFVESFVNIKNNLKDFTKEIFKFFSLKD